MKFKLIASLLLLILLLAACSSSPAESVEIADIHDEMVALTESPAAVPIYLSPEASGEKVQSGGQAKIDYSNTDDGYVMVMVTKDTSKKTQGAGGRTYHHLYLQHHPQPMGDFSAL